MDSGQLTLTKTPMTLDSSRPFQVQSMFKQRNASQVVMLVGLAYGLCSRAQRLASKLALADILPETVYWQKEADVVRLESIKEHLASLLQNWPTMLDRPSQPKLLLGLASWVTDLEAIHLRPVREEGLKQQQAQAKKELLQRIEKRLQTIIGVPLQDWLAMETLDDFEFYLAHTDSFATQTLTLAWHKHLTFAPSTQLPLAQSAELAKQLMDDLSGSEEEVNAVRTEWITQPTWQQQSVENSSFSRLQQTLETPLLQQLIDKYGQGLFSHMTAKLFDVISLFSELKWRLNIQADEAQNERISDNDDLIQTGRYQQGQAAVSWVDTARGRLFHYAKWNDENDVVDYAIIAPTEWNFHPEGFLKQTLANSAETLSFEHWKAQADCLMRVVDPCVSFRIQEQPMPPQQVALNDDAWATADSVAQTESYLQEADHA